MSLENDTTEVDVVIDEAPKEPEIVVKAEEPPAAPEITPDQAIDTLKKQIEAEKRAREEAEQRALQAEQTAHKAKIEVEDTNLQLVKNAIDTIERNSDILTKQYAEAMTVGDYEAAAKIQNNMAANHAKLLQLQAGKEALENRPKQPAPVAKSPVEELASKLSPRSAAWVRAHPDVVTDPRMYKKMVAAHSLAEADGVALDSDEYFDAIERTIGIKAPVQQAPQEDPMEHTARRQAPPAAPPSRGGNIRQMWLSAEEIEMASLMKMTPEEYAKQKMDIQKDAGRR